MPLGTLDQYVSTPRIRVKAGLWLPVSGDGFLAAGLGFPVADVLVSDSVRPLLCASDALVIEQRLYYLPGL